MPGRHSSVFGEGSLLNLACSVFVVVPAGAVPGEVAVLAPQGQKSFTFYKRNSNHRD